MSALFRRCSLSRPKALLCVAVLAAAIVPLTAYAIAIMAGDVITASDISATTQETYTYDNLGRVTNVSTDGVVTETFTYDAEGNITASTAQ